MLLVALAVNGVATSFRTMAWELHSQGKMMEAIRSMQAAVVHSPDDNTFPRFDLAMMWEDIGYLDEAEAGFQELSNECGRFKANLANVLLDGRGEQERALRLYRECCDATMDHEQSSIPNMKVCHMNALYGRGVCAESLGLADEASECYRRVLELNPASPDASAAFHLLVNTERRSGGECAEMREQLGNLQHKIDGWDYVRRQGLTSSTHY